MSRDYNYKNTPKFTTYPGGTTNDTAVLMVAQDGSLVSLTLNGLNSLLDSEGINTFPSVTTDSIIGNTTNTNLTLTPTGTGLVRITSAARIDGDLTVYGSVITPNQAPLQTQILFQPIIQNTDCGDLSAAGTDAFGVYLNYNYVADLNFAGPLNTTDLGVLT